jgi:hypothetical protein
VKPGASATASTVKTPARLIELVNKKLKEDAQEEVEIELQYQAML